LNFLTFGELRAERRRDLRQAQLAKGEAAAGSLGRRMESLDTVIIGAGQAGLATSYCLRQLGRDHVVLERSRVADTWRSRRWDSFTLVGPNWTCTLPGAPYRGRDPDGYMGKAELVGFFERYARSFDAPVREGVAARRLRRDDGAGLYIVETDEGEIQSRNVVVATGAYQRPKLPAISSDIDPRVAQLHSDAYRNPAQLPDGAILVVGSGQSGCQIAEDLREAGRDVYLATSSVGWFPRRYRGHDNVWWRNEMGFFEKTVDTLASPKDRMAAVPIQTGRSGGHDISLRTLAAMGVRLAGRLAAASGTRVRFADDLETNLARSDEVAHRLIAEIDDFIRARGIGAPPDLLDRSASGRSMRGITELDLEKARVGSVVWATGYEFDWGWVELPAFDEYAYPIQRQGVTSWPGLYFVGLHWMHTRGSGLIWGVGRDAEHIASHIAATRP